jgi:hypothetical protein
VAVLIIVACVALAVWTLQHPPASPPVPVVEATPTPRPARRETAVPTHIATAIPSAPPTTAPPTEEPKATLAVSTRIPLVLSSAPTDSRTATPPPTAVLATPTRSARGAAVLKGVSPLKVKRGGTALLDVRGQDLTADHHAIVLRGGHVPPDVAVPRQRYVGPTLIQVLLVVGASAVKGTYEVSVVDTSDRRSNAVSFEVIP